MLLNDAVRQAQTQPGAFADRFGSEEWIKYLGEVLLRNAGAVVLESNAHPLLRDTGSDTNQPARTIRFNSLPRIVDNVQEHLLNLVRIQQQSRQVRREVLL